MVRPPLCCSGRALVYVGWIEREWRQWAAAVGCSAAGSAAGASWPCCRRRVAGAASFSQRLIVARVRRMLCVRICPGCTQALTAKMAEIKNQDMEEEVAQALIQLCVDTMLKVRAPACPAIWHAQQPQRTLLLGSASRKPHADAC